MNNGADRQVLIMYEQLDRQTGYYYKGTEAIRSYKFTPLLIYGNYYKGADCMRFYKLQIGCILHSHGVAVCLVNSQTAIQVQNKPSIGSTIGLSLLHVLMWPE